MSSFKSPSSLTQRSSPFRRPASPASPSGRPSTPPSTSRAGASPMTSPSKLKQSYTVSEEEDKESTTTTPTRSGAPAYHAPSTISLGSPQPPARQLPSPPKKSIDSYSSRNTTTAHYGNGLPSSSISATDPLGRLPPALLHSLRESFSVLDPASTGTITPSSVCETLQSLGLDTSTINALFPPGSNQSITLPQYLNQLASILVNLSPPQEILNAFSAFDDDDSGQVDVAELRRALLTTPPDAGEPQLTDRDITRALDGFTGRRILGRGATGISGLKGLSTPTSARSGGEVFRYQEFVGSVTGTGMDGQQNTQTVGAR